MGLGVGFSIICWSSAFTLAYMHFKPATKQYSTVTDLRRKAKQHNTRNYKEPTKRGGF